MRTIPSKMMWALAALTLLAGCDGLTERSQNASQVGDERFSYWTEADAFAGAERSFLDWSHWIDVSDGTYLELQFQCTSSPEGKFPSKFELVASSGIDNQRNEYASPRYIDAVLFKVNDGTPQVYRRVNIGDYGGDVLGPFQGATLDIARMIEESGALSAKKLALRFVYGASPLTAQIGDVQELARYDSIDVLLEADDPAAGKILKDCQPNLSE